MFQHLQDVGITKTLNPFFDAVKLLQSIWIDSIQLDCHSKVSREIWSIRQAFAVYFQDRSFQSRENFAERTTKIRIRYFQVLCKIPNPVSILIFVNTKLSFWANHPFRVYTSHCPLGNRNPRLRKWRAYQSSRYKKPLSHIRSSTNDLKFPLCSAVHLANIEFVSIRVFLDLFYFPNHNRARDLPFCYFLDLTSLENQIFCDILRRCI